MMPSATGKGARVLQHRVRSTFQRLFQQDSFEGAVLGNQRRFVGVGKLRFGGGGNARCPAFRANRIPHG